ncbi:MAG: sel1 repeat family protein [Candidatus Methanoplasma sp.]|jgi:TPR repeat protein|nr:sel1 repeat family protein [Candidatus Methanoplasma sp.]
MAEKKMIHDAEAGNPYARLGLAYMYHHGKNVDPCPEKAIKWYIRSAELGCSRAKWELAKIYRDGTIAEKDNKKFTTYLKAAAESGIPEAKAELGLEYLSGTNLEKDAVLAFRWMHSAAVQGNPAAQFMTGYMYGKGIGTDQNIPKMEQWYTKARLKGGGELFYRIGRNLEYGLSNVEVDLLEASMWYKTGADKGHELCIVSWQSVFSALDGGRHDTIEEREHKLVKTDVVKEKLAREQALTAADRFLEAGDEESAFNNYMLAADLGEPTAMFTLALMYHVGVYVKRNDNTALELMMKASLAGSEDAQFTMGTLYEEGRVLKESHEEAIKYYTMAAANGYLAAYYRLSLYMGHPEIHVRNSAVAVRW